MSPWIVSVRTTPVSPRPPRTRSGAAVLFSRLLPAATLLVAVLAVVGCGGGKKADDDVLLATVGDKEIRSHYYEDRLSLMKREELPRDETGRIMDMATQAGKEKFLETLITKEVMAKTAESLGYGSDPQIVGARNSLISYEAGLALWANEIVEPANFISEEQLQTFYGKLGSSRQCRYVITNFLDRAEAARKYALTGADWQDVVEKFHEGDPDPAGKYEINVPYGRYNTTFENGVFGPAIGDVTEPIPTVYGFWVLKIDSEKPGKRPPLDEAKAQILDTVHARTKQQLREDFKTKVREKYKFFIDETALWKCYEGLPATEDIFYPGTKDPVRKEDLKPLDIPTADRELPFYGYVKPDGTERVYTLGDYKATFDNMSVFQRPKRAQMLGGLRSKITEELEKTLLNFEAEQLGYFEAESVLFKVDAKIEELLVNKLYNEAVAFDKRVTPEQLDAFWAEHRSEYDLPETRDGRIVVCADRQSADGARAAAAEGVAWRDILVKFGTDKDNKSRSGKLEGVRADAAGPARDQLFALAEGGVSPVFNLEDGRFAVVMLEKVSPPRARELLEVSEAIGQRMRQAREEEAFQALLAQWKKDLTIVTYPENLAGLKSWQELTSPPAPENVVPRNN